MKPRECIAYMKKRRSKRDANHSQRNTNKKLEFDTLEPKQPQRQPNVEKVREDETEGIREAITEGARMAHDPEAEK